MRIRNIIAFSVVIILAGLMLFFIFQFEGEQRKGTEVVDKKIPVVRASSQSQPAGSPVVESSLPLIQEKYNTEIASAMGISNVSIINQYNSLINSFFQKIEAGEYDKALQYLDQDFLRYKGITKDTELKSYIEQRKWDHVSCEVVALHPLENTTSSYLAESIFIPTQGLKMTEDQFRVFIREKRKNIEERIVFHQKGTVTSIAFEGFVEHVAISQGAISPKEVDLKVTGIDILYNQVLVSLELWNKTTKNLKYEEMVNAVGLYGEAFFTPGEAKGLIEVPWLPNQRKTVIIRIPYTDNLSRSLRIETPFKNSEKILLNF